MSSTVARKQLPGLSPFHDGPLGSFVQLWRYRHALLNFTLTLLRTRYKRSILGFIWSLINPLLFILTFVVVFELIWRVREPNYSAKLFCTLLTWRFFNSAVMDGASSVGSKVALMKRVSFPRIVLPASTLLANFIDFLLSVVILAVYFTAVRVTLDWPYMLLALLGLVILIVFSFGLSLILSAVATFYQDIKFLVGSLFQMWMWFSPVIYSVRKVAESGFSPALLKLYFLNPVAPLMMAFSSILPGPELRPDHFVPHYYTYLAISGAVSLVALIIGLVVFKHMEPAFAKEV